MVNVHNILFLGPFLLMLLFLPTFTWNWSCNIWHSVVVLHCIFFTGNNRNANQDVSQHIPEIDYMYHLLLTMMFTKCVTPNSVGDMDSWILFPDKSWFPL